MSIKQNWEKIKSLFSGLKYKLFHKESRTIIKSDIFIVILMILLGLSSYGLGKLSSMEKGNDPTSLQEEETIPTTPIISKIIATSTKISENNTGLVFASKSGTKYYYPNCTSRVKEENKVWFNSIQEAESVGLTLASGCVNK